MNEEEKEAIECLELVIDSESDIETEDLTNKCINNVLNLIKKQQKVIDEMASYLSRIRTCPNADCDVDIDCERRCNLTDEIQGECWKIYFNRKVECDDR